MAQIVNTHIVLRNDTSANWQAHSDQILLKGEIGIEFLPIGEKKFKIGDGVTPWKQLPYGLSVKAFEEAFKGLIDSSVILNNDDKISTSPIVEDNNI